MDKAEALIQSYIKDYLKKNRPARILAQGLDKLGVGFRPVADHITIRTTDVYKVAKKFLKLGFVRDKKIGPNGILDYGDWFAIVLRKPGLPAIFIDQGKFGEKGKTSVIPGWVKKFGDRTLHHVAIQIDDIEKAVKAMKKLGIEFVGEIVGKRGSSLRQIFTKPELKNNEPFTVLELAERHRGYDGFQPPQADRLMQSTRLNKSTDRSKK
jgi:catechol 2,3-dioxygenase-like lactoylglutathione lyase family enzyme